MEPISILQTLEDEGGCCKYEKLVEGRLSPLTFASQTTPPSYMRTATVGEGHECGTVSAMLKILKKKKKIKYARPFLMYPNHKNDIVALKSYKGSRNAPKRLTRGRRKSKKKKVYHSTHCNNPTICT